MCNNQHTIKEAANLNKPSFRENNQPTYISCRNVIRLLMHSERRILSVLVEVSKGANTSRGIYQRPHIKVI